MHYELLATLLNHLNEIAGGTVMNRMLAMNTQAGVILDIINTGEISISFNSEHGQG